MNATTKHLSVLLADIHQLYIKTLGFHWNVEDPRFMMLHEFFETLYVQLANDMDEVAERIRKLGEKSPGSIKQLTELKRLKDVEGSPSGNEMIEQLLKDYEQLIGYLKHDIEKTDIGTADMLTQILRQYEKNAWMLRSHL